ncbi:MAG: hypothetical protein AAF692_07135 [Pseudomonadota bacterium]
MPTSSTATRRRRKRDLKNMAIEVGVIVAGVGLALFGEYAISEWNWSKRVDRAEKELRAEASILTYNLVEAIIIKPCVAAQIDALEAHLLDSSKNNEAYPYPEIETVGGKSVIRKSSRSWPEDAWLAALNDGTAARMDETLRNRTALYYQQIKRIRENRVEVDSLGAQINIAAQPITRTPQTTQDLLIKLGEFRYLRDFNALSAEQILSTLRDLDRLPDDDFLERFVNNKTSGTLTYCQDTNLPLNLPQDGWADWPEKLDAPAAGRVFELN